MTITRKSIIFSHHAKQRAEERGLKLGSLFEQKIRNTQRQHASDGSTQRVFPGDRRVLDGSDEFSVLQPEDIVVITRESDQTIVVITAYRKSFLTNSLQSRQQTSGLGSRNLTLVGKARANRLERRKTNRELRFAA